MSDKAVSVVVSPTAAQRGSGRDPSPVRRLTGLLAGVAVLLVMLAIGPPEGLAPEAWKVAAVGLLMAVWWISEAIPIAATALAPLALFPLLGVMPMKNAATPYANPLIFLFLGGFMIALAMERWSLHRRIALFILGKAGFRPAALVGGFMTATAFLSAWVSNTATATMMLPIGLSVIKMIHKQTGKAEDEPDNFAVALLLSIAYGAGIGGMATLVGTPPNALLAGFMNEAYGFQVGFAQWLAVGGPVAVVLLALGWLILTKLVFPMRDFHVQGGEALMQNEIAALGPLSTGEKLVALVFATTATLWILRPTIDQALPFLNITDAGIAVAAGLAMFAIPADWKNRQFLMDWPMTNKLPWGVLLLVGGGLSLGAAINGTGLSEWIAAQMQAAEGWPTVVMILVVALAVMGISHLTSNTATAAAFLPLIASLAISLGENPLMLAVPTVLAASCVFMMPVATPPNAIVFGSGMITVPQMVRAGALICLVGLGLILVAAYALLPVVFGVTFGEVPPWAG